MVISMETLLEAINHHEKEQKLTEIVLEAIASKKDNEIMNGLMMELLHKNATLNTQLEEKLEEIVKLSVTDQLTGLYNRRKLLENLRIEMNRLERYEHAFSLIMFDIDHFKNVNDTYGHDIGDHVLIKLSTLVGKMLRESDLFARWGGEEFMILVPGTSLDNTVVIAEKLRHAIEMFDFSPGPSITCSFGVSTCVDVATCNETVLIKKVDKALYEAKETGRNKVLTH